MRLRWVPSDSSNATKQEVVTYVRQQKLSGTPPSMIVEKLLARGLNHSEVKQALASANKRRDATLDWRSPTAINATARMIRSHIRSGKVSYVVGMTVLFRARNMLRTLVKNTRVDKRLDQINWEIRTTKRLMWQLANRDMKRAYKVFAAPTLPARELAAPPIAIS